MQLGGEPTIRGLSVRLGAGETAVLIGPNGCGKTTLGRLVTGHAPLRSGRVRVLGEELGRTDVRALRRRVGVMNPQLSSSEAHTPGAVLDADLRAVDAVCTGFFGTVGRYDEETPEQREAAAEAIRGVGLGDRLTQRVKTFSTGELRRLLLARTLVMRPGLLVLDEPTAGLDLPGRVAFLATLDRLRAGPDRPAVLLVTHHPEEIPTEVDAVWLMSAGRLVAAGPPEELMTADRLGGVFSLPVRLDRVGSGWSMSAARQAGTV